MSEPKSYAQGYLEAQAKYEAELAACKDQLAATDRVLEGVSARYDAADLELTQLRGKCALLQQQLQDVTARLKSALTAMEAENADLKSYLTQYRDNEAALLQRITILEQERNSLLTGNINELYEARDCATLGTSFRDIFDSKGNVFACEVGKYHADLFCANHWAFGNSHAPTTKLRTWMIEAELKNMPDSLKRALVEPEPEVKP